jgi:hypothetical protein
MGGGEGWNFTVQTCDAGQVSLRGMDEDCQGVVMTFGLFNG